MCKRYGQLYNCGHQCLQKSTCTGQEVLCICPFKRPRARRGKVPRRSRREIRIPAFSNIQRRVMLRAGLRCRERKIPGKECKCRESHPSCGIRAIGSSGQFGTIRGIRLKTAFFCRYQYYPFHRWRLGRRRATSGPRDALGDLKLERSATLGRLMRSWSNGKISEARCQPPCLRVERDQSFRIRLHNANRPNAPQAA